jgi:hypothetical protein
MEPERRRKPRLYQSIPLAVRGQELSGNPYRFETIAPDVSASGLCAFAPRIMNLGEKVSMRIRFARLGCKPIQAPEISLRGEVVRVEPGDSGYCKFAVSFILRRIR